MYKLKEIADKVYYVGVNDRQKALLRICGRCHTAFPITRT